MVCGCFFQFLCQRKLSMKNASSTKTLFLLWFM
jgi:hypothetical protein